MSTIHAIHTPCKNCVFAKYEENTQTGCELDYIEKYKNLESEILEVYDNDKEFYVINDKKCLGYREPKWFEQLGMSDSSMEEKINHFNLNNKLNFILLLNLKNYTVEQLDNTLKQIRRADAQPTKIILLRYQDQIHLAYNTINKLLSDNNISSGWRIQSMVDNNLSYIEILHNTVVLNSKYRFMLSVEKFSEELENIINISNNIIHNQLKQFGVLTTKDKNCICFSLGVYRYAVAHQEHILSDPDKFETI